LDSVEAQVRANVKFAPRLEGAVRKLLEVRIGEAARP